MKERQGFTAVCCAVIGGMGGWGLAGLGAVPEGAKAADLLSFLGAIIGVIGAFGAAQYGLVSTRQMTVEQSKKSLILFLMKLKRQFQGYPVIHVGITAPQCERLAEVQSQKISRLMSDFRSASNDLVKFDEGIDQAVGRIEWALAQMSWTVGIARAEAPHNVEKSYASLRGNHTTLHNAIDEVIASLR
ncbi:MAG: hypothetical protein VX205_00155 [Pseudomonadota bacterium]|nr:hypothetical protein [Pseudomonadota bacterium]